MQHLQLSEVSCVCKVGRMNFTPPSLRLTSVGRRQLSNSYARQITFDSRGTVLHVATRTTKGLEGNYFLQLVVTA